MKNRIISLLLVLTMLVAAVPMSVSSASDEPSGGGKIANAEYVNSAEIYRDVKAGSWYKKAVDYVSTYGIMEGAGDADTFKPAYLSSRAMIAVILHRIEGEPKAQNSAPFEDLKAKWYRDAVNWAYEAGVVSGRSKTEFDPDGNVTRQELVKMIFNYLEYKKLDSTGVGDIEEFQDYKLVASWASQATSWALCAGIIRGRSNGDTLSLAPLAESQRSELATVFLRFCEKYDLVEEPYMTLEEIIADINSDRTKKVILDCDAGNEMDDQYAIAYAAASDKLDVIAANGTLFYNEVLVDSFEDGMKESYNEIVRVFEQIGCTDVPVYYGCTDPLSESPGLVPGKSEAVDNIVKAAQESDEIIYIITTGAATNVASAILKDPTITDKICVIWLGGQYPNVPDKGGEYNLGQDLKAGQYLFNCGVNLVQLPGYCPDGDGTAGLRVTRSDMFEAFPGTNEASEFFRETLALECDGSFETDPDGWTHVMWDIAGTAVLDVPDTAELGIITAPRIRNDMSYAHGENRHSIITLKKLESETILDRAFGCINSMLYEPDIPAPETMTLDDILEDIKSDRKKKVILDCDAGNEIDDQYAIAYALGCEKLDVLSINASQFLNTALVPTRKDGMIEGYNEIKRVLKLVGREDVPVYYGCEDSVTKSEHSGQSHPQVTPLESEAVDNIINTAKASREMIYIIVTGCATNISCAIAKDPSIMDKICVVWMGSNHPDYSRGADEFNLGQDSTAGRYLLNSGVNLIWVPAMSDDSTEGSQVLKEGRAFLESSFPGDDAASSYFRRDLPLEHDGGYNENPETWWHIYWDAAAVAVFDCPELCSFTTVDLPRVRGDGTFAIESGRPKAIMLEKLTPAPVLDNMVDSINSLIGE